MTTTTQTITTCTTCATAIAHGETEHLDNAATVEAFIESAGLLAYVGEVDLGGYYDCPACGEVSIGTAAEFEPIAPQA